MEYFKLKLDRTSIEHRRPSINVRSLLPSTNCVTKETISQSANSESFRTKMRDTPRCFPILTILVSNCLYFHLKWRKACHFDARTVDSFVLKRDWGSQCWPWMTTNVFSHPSRTANGIALRFSTGKWKYVNPCLYFSRYTRSTYGVRTTACATQIDVRT